MKTTTTIAKFTFLGSAVMATATTIAAVCINPALMMVAIMFVIVMVCSK